MTNSTSLEITPEIATLIVGALDSGNVLLLAAVSPDQKPILSFRGSTAVFSPNQLSLWVRNTTGGTLAAIRANPEVALMYRSQTVPMLQFAGQARIATTEPERDRAFMLAHERERKSDVERKGAAVIIDLERISGVLGFGADGPIFCNMSR